jgi:uncharacterized membrane protein YgcG
MAKPFRLVLKTIAADAVPSDAEIVARLPDGSCVVKVRELLPDEPLPPPPPPPPPPAQLLPPPRPLIRPPQFYKSLRDHVPTPLPPPPRRSLTPSVARLRAQRNLAVLLNPAPRPRGRDLVMEKTLQPTPSLRRSLPQLTQGVVGPMRPGSRTSAHGPGRMMGGGGRAASGGGGPSPGGGGGGGAGR